MKLLIFPLLLTPAFAQQQYHIDPAHSAAHFSIRHMTISNVQGQFSNVSGVVTLDSKNPANSKVDATVDTTTVNTLEPKRDADLKSANFFDVAKFPTMIFKSTSVQKSGDGYTVVGDLTIHGVTKPVTLTVDGPTAEVKDPYGFLRAGANATTTINRKDFGLVWNQTLDNGGVVLGDQVGITLDLEMVRKP